MDTTGSTRVEHVPVRNGLLAQLANADRKVYDEVLADLEPIPLERGALLGAARERAEWVYFVDSGIVSLVASTSSGQSVEVAVVGREGAAGVADDSQPQAVAQGRVRMLRRRRQGAAIGVRSRFFPHKPRAEKIEI